MLRFCIGSCPFFYFTILKESNRDEMMKNINVQCKVEYCQKNEKIEELYPQVCTSVRECNPVFCCVVYPALRRFWVNVLDMRCDASCFCFLSPNQSDSGDSGRWNIALINVPQHSSSNSLNLSEDDRRELCSECGVADWILGCNNTGRGCYSSTSTSSSASPSSWSSWKCGGWYAASSWRDALVYRCGFDDWSILWSWQ